MKPLLSIIIPVAPGREARLKAILSRLQLNSIRFPDHTFEVVVVDGGSASGQKDFDGGDTVDIQKLCSFFSKYINLKYIYVPIGKFICAAYPRNIALRVCEGDIVGMIDVDHWPSENIVYGMLAPFINDDEFRVFTDSYTGQVKNWYQKVPVQNNIINRGYVIDSSKSKRYIGNEILQKFNQHMLDNDAMGYVIEDVYKQAQIPPPGTNNTLWNWAVKREHVLAMNGYDEVFCRNYAYSREDDDWRMRLLAQGLSYYDGQNKNFCSIHLWHLANCRTNFANKLNQEYYSSMWAGCPQTSKATMARNVPIKRNVEHQWGKLLTYSFSVIDEKQHDITEHEKWIEKNISDMPFYVNAKPYVNADDFIRFLEIWVC
jgi:glycosyltransferase involved in cell wall biosynthesis